MNYKLILGSLFVICLLTSTAYAITVDGNPSDWGIDLTQGLSGNTNAWIPSSATSEWKVEDNIDDDCSPYTWLYGDCKDWTGYQAQGIHIEGNGTEYWDYDEPANLAGAILYDGPAGGEPYDIEALYFDDASGYAYFMIITSMPEAGYTDQWGRFTMPGDIAIDADNNPATGEFGYEYGIKTYGPNKGQVCYMPDWNVPGVSGGFPQNAPAQMNCDAAQSVVMGTAYLVYQNTGVSDNGFTNYVVEAGVPKRYLGNPQIGDNGELHVTITCGNDVIEIGTYSYDFPSPEFISMLIPLLILLAAPVAAYKASKK